MKKLFLIMIALVTLASGAWAAGCCDPGADCCSKGCCKRVSSK